MARESYFLASSWRLARVNPDKRITIFRIQDPYVSEKDFQIISSCEITLETNGGLYHETLSEGLGESGEQFYVFLLIYLFIKTTH